MVYLYVMDLLMKIFLYIFVKFLIKLMCNYMYSVCVYTTSSGLSARCIFLKNVFLNKMFVGLIGLFELMMMVLYVFFFVFLMYLILL